MSYPALILAKSKSTRLPGKNNLDFHGKSMFMVNVEKCLKIFDKVYVSSDSQLMLDMARKAGAVPIWRTQKLCGDVPNIPVYRHAVAKMGEIDGIIAIQANSPTLSSDLLSLSKKIMELGIQELMTCHSNRSIYGSIWGLSLKRLMGYTDFYHPNPEALILDTSIDIHTWDDYELALKEHGN